MQYVQITDRLETDILMLCLRRIITPDQLERIRGINAQEWSEVINLANQNGVGQLLHYRLKQLNISLPTNLAMPLRDSLLWNTGRNTLIYHELVVVLERLQLENIPVILLKGAYLAKEVYENIGLRTMSDIDLLVPESDIERTIGVLESIGFKPDRAFFHEADGSLHYHAPPMTKGGLVIELHWGLTRDTNLSNIITGDLWQRAQLVTLNELTVRALGLSDLVLHLAVHISYGHRFSYQLRSMVDLDMVISKNEGLLNWTEIVDICRDWQADRGIYLTFRLVMEFFIASIPDNVLQSLKPSDWDERALTWAKNRIFQNTPILSENYIRLMHSPSYKERIGALIEGLFPSRKVMAMEYGIPPGSKRIITYYPLHAITRIKKYWKYALQLKRGDRIQAIESTSDQSLRDWMRVN